MADDQKTPAPAEPQGSGKAAKPAPRKTGGPSGRVIAAVAILLILVTAAAGGAGGYYLWRQQQDLAAQQKNYVTTLEMADLRDKLKDRADQLGARMDSLASQQSNTVQHLASLDESLKGIRNAQDNVQQQLQKVERLAAVNRDDWVRSEAAYLARLARYRVTFRRDVDGALDALKTADGLLARLGGQAVDARQAVAKAVNELLAVKQPDLQAVNHQLSTLISQAPDLPVVRPGTTQAKTTEPPEPKADLSTLQGWRQAAGRAWDRFTHSIAQLVVIQRRDQTPPLVKPDERPLVHQNLILRLEQARLAAAQANGELYNQSLNEAKQWLETYFEPQAAPVQQALATIRQLSSVNVAPALPTLDELKGLAGESTPGGTK